MIDIPNKAVAYISLQRTGYLRGNRFYGWLKRIEKKNPLLLNLSSHIKNIFFANSIKDQYINNLTAEYRALTPYIPKQATNILDIGSGLALTNLFLYRHYDGSINIHLLDKTEIERDIYYGFNPKRTPFYNSMELAKEILTHNGVKEDCVYVYEVGNHQHCFGEKKYDLITSYISLGFHYPVTTYLREIVLSLKDDGVLILDVRKDTGQIQELEKCFKNIDIISDEGKSMRVAAQFRALQK